MLQTQRGHNDYDKEEDLLKTYLKEKDEGMKGEFHGDQHVAFNSKVMISKHEKMHLSEHFSNFSIFLNLPFNFSGHQFKGRARLSKAVQRTPRETT